MEREAPLIESRIRDQVSGVELVDKNELIDDVITSL